MPAVLRVLQAFCVVVLASAECPPTTIVHKGSATVSTTKSFDSSFSCSYGQTNLVDRMKVTHYKINNICSTDGSKFIAWTAPSVVDHEMLDGWRASVRESVSSDAYMGILMGATLAESGGGEMALTATTECLSYNYPLNDGFMRIADAPGEKLMTVTIKCMNSWYNCPMTYDLAFKYEDAATTSSSTTADGSSDTTINQGASYGYGDWPTMTMTMTTTLVATTLYGSCDASCDCSSCAESLTCKQLKCSAGETFESTGCSAYNSNINGVSQSSAVQSGWCVPPTTTSTSSREIVTSSSKPMEIVTVATVANAASGAVISLLFSVALLLCTV